MYTGELDLTKQSGEDILGLLVASDELLIEGLFKYVQEYLIKYHSAWVRQNWEFVLHIVLKLACCEKLQDYCMEFNPQSIMIITSETFLSLDKDTLFRLFKRGKLQIDEIVIWENLIKWGIRQTPELE